MIMLQLRSNPKQRPTVDMLLQDEFFTSGMMPAALPVTCLTTAPRTDQLEGLSLQRRPFNELNDGQAPNISISLRFKKNGGRLQYYVLKFTTCVENTNGLLRWLVELGVVLVGEKCPTQGCVYLLN